MFQGTMKVYTSHDINEDVARNEERLFAPWMVGRPDGYKADSRTKATVCLSYWLREELTKLGLSEDDRKIQENAFHRWSRSRDDVFELAAEIMNDAASGNILRDRVPHHRWG